MSKKSTGSPPADRDDRQRPVAEPITLATLLAALEWSSALSATRLRDLRSAVKRVSILLANDPGGIDFDLSAISTRLATISPVAVGMTAKRLANIRSDFLAAVKASGLMPVRVETKKKTLSPAWVALFARLSGRRAHIGLSRLARYASAKGTEPRDINDAAIDGFIAEVREGSLHQNPRALHRQVTLIWNAAAHDPKLGLPPVTVVSFRGPPQRIEWSVLPASFRRDVDDYLSWACRSDPFAADARQRALAPKTLHLRRDQILLRGCVRLARLDTSDHPFACRPIHSLNFKSILRRRLAIAGGEDNSFNKDLGIILVLIAREWVTLKDPSLAELKRLVSKLPVPIAGLTDKNKRFLRQFDDPRALRRLIELPKRLWAESEAR